VSGYEASCPSCGGTLVFRLGASLLRVCDHCGSAVARKGANLADYGKVAELLPTPSVLKLGLDGDYPGAPPFTLVGRLQIDHGAGTWDEWLMAFAGGTWAWLSESQGKFHYLGVAALPPVPAFEDITPGATIDLGPPGTFVVTEVREARFVTAQGEVPFDVAPGSRLHYADLSGPGGQFATLDYGTGSAAEALYVGREVTLDELGFKDLPTDEERRKRVEAKSLSCPQCAGPLEVRVPGETQRIACVYCGSLLDAGNFAVLEALSKAPVKPRIPLGSTGRLGGVVWTLIGFMERSVTVDAVRYPWQEYLLHEPRRGYRWLVHSKGHWSFVEPVPPGDVREGRLASEGFRGRPYKHFQGGVARVDHVVGEFYWAVARGDSVQTQDYVSPPFMLSQERDGKEIVWSLGTYTPAEDVWKAFKPPGNPPPSEGVAPHQPWPHAAAFRAVWSLALLATALILALYVGLSVAGGEVVHRQQVSLSPATQPGAPEAALFTEPFFVLSSGNLEVRVRAPVDNSWLYLDGALINEESGEVDAFDVEAAYYHGTDSDGAWSEGGREAAAYVPTVEPGRYVLRLAPQWEAARMPAGYELTVRSRVPRFRYALAAGLAVLAWPLLLTWRRVRFEMQRWSESDHPWISSESED
jgi:hypothetical protein